MADYTYLSLGAGLQSSALLVMSNLELHDCPRADVAIFADTGSEPEWVYENLEHLRQWSEIPVETVQRGNLGADALETSEGKRNRFASLPLFIKNDDGKRGILRRQCTREYKVEPIEKRVRHLLGYRPRQRIREKVDALIGISIEEAGRCRPSRTRWITNRHPLLDARLSRTQCQEILTAQGLPIPKKSACVFCPYRDNKGWRQMRDESPEEWEKAVAFDEAVRDMTQARIKKPGFVHSSLKPLRDAPIDVGTDQLDMFTEECEGMCGV